MSDKAKLEYFRAKGLLPWQLDFALRFLESEDKRYWELVAPTGAGKTHLATVLIAHEMEDGSDKRILVLAPAQTLLMWQSQLLSFWSTLSVPVCTPLIVDRKTYLELESQVPVGHSPWPLPAIILMSIDLAKREDMAAKLSDIRWDLLIFDDIHRFTGKRRALFDRLTRSGAIRHALLLAQIEHPLPSDIVTTVRITLKDVVNWKGRPLFGPFEKFVQVYYQRTEEERAFLSELLEFTDQLANKWSLGKWQEKIILHVASSSMYATAGVLLRLQDVWRSLQNKIAHGIPWTNEDVERVQQQLISASDEPESIAELVAGRTIQPEEFLAFYPKLELLLNQIEEFPGDPKMDTLIYHITKFCEAKDKPYLCIISSFKDTVQYVNSSVQDLEIPVFSLTSSQEFNERMSSIKAFQENGGLLIATDAGLEGVALENVAECINYDLPIDTRMFKRRWGRFARFGRKGGFRMVVFRDQTKALSWEEDLFKTLDDMVSSEEGSLWHAEN